MARTRPWLPELLLVCLLSAPVAFAQIDPDRRELIQFGYNQPLEGHPPPFSAYAFYYDNRPGFLETNITLRLAVAPTYLDSEMAFAHLLGPNTDFAVGLAGGGFADSYYEIRRGKYLRDESFDGDGATGSASIYHLFDPGHLIPLYGILRGDVHQAIYVRNDDTNPSFEMPDNVTSFDVKTGLRLGGKEPVLTPDMAMELSIWYQGSFRLGSGDYGFDNDRHLNSASHLVWSRALLAYTLPKSKQNFYVAATAGTSASADRFSAYRLGGELPFASEFPLSLPGYYNQELSATRFIHFTGNYSIPLTPDKRWEFNAMAATALVNYLPGLEQPGNWHSGVGGGIGYHSKSDAWRIMLDYAYGFDAIRSDGRGAQTISLLFQLNLEHARGLNPHVESGFMNSLGGLLHSFN